eukprot:11083833-Alexandrium_andersonii.AAC.1
MPPAQRSQRPVGSLMACRRLTPHAAGARLARQSRESERLEFGKPAMLTFIPGGIADPEALR